MANDWIPMRIDLHGDPSVMRMANKLKTSTDEIVGRLLRVWGWANTHLRDGWPVRLFRHTWGAS